MLFFLRFGLKRAVDGYSDINRNLIYGYFTMQKLKTDIDLNFFADSLLI